MGQCHNCRQFYTKNERHCSRCHETFTNMEALEYHLQGGMCWAKTAFELDLVQDDHAVWMRGEDTR